MSPISKSSAAVTSLDACVVISAAASMPFPEERLDRVVDVVLRVHAACQHLLVVAQVLVQDVDEVAAAVGAGHLAVAEHVAVRQQLLLEHLHALAAVGLAAV